ncbi:hypothetical protein GS511_02490 [Leptospira borgpetersenii]|nr:hypothetical protein GS511_02490 [Leptospira borgpetersenii]QHH63078.1 hypothetical protein GS521_02790 [Leptospira borgpetersenii]
MILVRVFPHRVLAIINLIFNFLNRRSYLKNISSLLKIPISIILRYF